MGSHFMRCCVVLVIVAARVPVLGSPVDKGIPINGTPECLRDKDWDTFCITHSGYGGSWNWGYVWPDRPCTIDYVGFYVWNYTVNGSDVADSETLIQLCIDNNWRTIYRNYAHGDDNHGDQSAPVKLLEYTGAGGYPRAPWEDVTGMRFGCRITSGAGATRQGGFHLIEMDAVPEPATLVLMVLSTVLLLSRRRI